MPDTNLDPLEAAVLQKLLEGDHPVLAALRLRMPGLSVSKRERSSVGFFTELSVAKGAPLAPGPTGRVPFGDVEATLAGLQHGAGFLLYVEGGLLSMLEGYSYEE